MLFEKQILAMYRKMAFARCDGDGTAYYFSEADFPGLMCESYPFPATAGHTLAGYLYAYEGPTPGRLIVFDHGFGGGHRSYMKEIELLARHGYLVLAYDHTGCMASGGDATNGMGGSLSDLHDCLCFVERDARFAGYDISVVGHSWGGYAAMNAAALHPGISHAVVLSGFVSVELLVRSFFGGLLAPFRSAVMALEREANPKTVDLDGAETLKSASARALCIYSENDPLVRRSLHFAALEKALGGKENAKLLLVKNKGHNPNYTEKAVAQLAAYGKARTRFLKKNPHATDEEKAAFRATFDFHAMTEQDSAVWSEIFAFLNE